MIMRPSQPAASVVIMALAVYTGLIASTAHAGSLYHCETPDHRIIYTDSPAQLDQCRPVTFTQPHSTANTSVAGTASPPEPPIAPHIPASGSPTETPSAPVTVTEASTPAAAPPTEPPCQPGLNPLNPLSAPPCQP